MQGFISVLAFFVLGLFAQGDDSIGDLRKLKPENGISHFVMPPYADLSAWNERRSTIRQQILVSAGLSPRPSAVRLTPRRFGRITHGSIAIEKVTIQTLPGFRLAGNLYLPTRISSKLPAVLLAHGHWKQGRIHHADDYSVPALAATLAARGFVVFAYDMIGYNDTKQLPHKFGDSKTEMLWSFGPMGIQLLNSIRALDFLSALKEVDPNRIGMTGVSGGASQTLHLTAVDDRIKASAPGGMVSATFQGDDSCEEAPGLHVGLSNMEIAAVTAPRPLLLVSATGDWTKNTPQVEFPAVQSIYRLYGKAGMVENAHIDAGHNGNAESRRAVISFFERKLKGTNFVEGSEVDLSKLHLESLLIGLEATHERERIFSYWKELSASQAARLSPDQNRTRFRASLGLDGNRISIVAIHAGDRLLLENVSTGERVKTRWLVGAEKGTAIIAHSKGLRDAMDSEQAATLRSEGFSILFMELYEDEGLGDSKHTLNFRHSDDANRVRDLIAGIRFVTMQHQSAGTKPKMVCLGESGPWCLAAAAASLDKVILEMDAEDFEDSDSQLTKRLFLPGLQRLGGVSMLRRLISQ